jgi:hypothetical protein
VPRSGHGPAQDHTFGALTGLRGRGAAGKQSRLPVEFAVLEVLLGVQIVQRRQRFLVVEARQDVAGLDRLALAQRQRSTIRPRTSGVVRAQVSGSTAPVA